MNQDLHPGKKMARFNPFVFPSDTDFRFGLLIVAVVSAGLYIYFILFIALANTSLFGNIGETYVDCVAAQINLQGSGAASLLSQFSNLLGSATGSGSLAPFSASSLSRETPYDACVKTYLRIQGFWMLGGTLGIMLLAFALYWTEPGRKIRRDKLIPFTSADDPEIYQALVGLCQEAELTKAPAIVWDPLNPDITGLAFGRIGKRFIAIPGGLVALYQTDLAEFKAIVRHELAHLKNADVDKTHFAMAAWQAFIFLGVAPLLVNLIHGLIFGPFSFDLFSTVIILDIMILTMIVYLFRNSVLRARESYADIRASVWDGPEGGLVQALQGLPQLPKRFWNRIFSVHPDPRVRITAIEDPQRLTIYGFWSFLVIGFTAAVAFDGLDTMFYNLIPSNQAASSIYYAGLIFSLLLALIVSIILWQYAFFAGIRKGPTPRIGRLSLGLAIGLGLGELFSIKSSSDNLIYTLMKPPSSVNASPVLSILTFAACFLLFWGLIYLLMKWLYNSSSVWAQTIHTRSRLWLLILSSVLIVGFILTFAVPIFLNIQSDVFSGTGWANGLVVLFGNLFLGFSSSAMLFIPVSLSIFPLLAFFKQKDVLRSVPEWAYLDKTEMTPVAAEEVKLRPRYAALVGLIAAGAYILLTLLLVSVLHVSLPAAVREGDTFKISLFILVIALGGVFQLVDGLIVFYRTRVARNEHAIFSSLVGGLTMAIGFLIINLIFGGSIDFSFGLMTINFFIKVGFGVVLLVTLVCLLLSKGINLFTVRPIPS